MALQTVQPATYPSFTPTYSAVSASDTVPPGDDVRAVVKNGGGSSINVTVSSFPDTSPFGTAIPDLVVAVPAGGERWIGPLRGSSHADPATGLVTLGFSATTSVTAAYIQD